MAYRLEKNNQSIDIVIDGFENGIADSPHEGIGDMRNMNIISVPGEASVNFKTAAMTIPPTVSAVAFTAAIDDLITVASTSGYYAGMAITFNTIGTTVGISTGRVYWIGTLTATTFTVHLNPVQAINGTNIVNITVAGSGTLSSYTLGAGTFSTIDYTGGNNSPRRNYEFFVDSNGRVWWFANPGGTATGTLIYLGNDTLTSATGQGICAFLGYLFVFRDTAIDYLPTSAIEGGVDLDSGSGWVYGWDTIDSAKVNHQAISAQDRGMYICASNRIKSYLENAGTTFDPTNATTYTENVAALNLPAGDQPTWIAELSTDLLIGGIRNWVYPWDRISTSFRYPLIIAENYTTRIVSTNSNAYIFAGNRGRIYVTNGSNMELYRKVPDYVSGAEEPYYTWLDACYWRDQLYFSFTATTNAGAALTTTGGLWAISVSDDSLRHTNKLSYDTYAGSATVIVPNVITTNPAGGGLFTAWTHSGSFGVDQGSVDPYTNFQSSIESDLIPIGTYLDSTTIQQVEFKLSQPMVSGEGVKLYYRQNMKDAYVLMSDGSSSSGTFGTVGELSGYVPASFQKGNWLQLKVETSSTATTPTYTRLKELRIRK